MKRTVKIKLALVNRNAISFDPDEGGKIRFQFDATQTATVAEMLLAGEQLIDVTFVFDDQVGDA